MGESSLKIKQKKNSLGTLQAHDTIRLCVSGVLPTSPQYNRVGSEILCSPQSSHNLHFREIQQ